MNYLKSTGTVCNIQRFCTDDGAGIRTTVFLKGCPLKCKWCHNIESISFQPQLAYYSSNCIRCKECINTCPIGAIDMCDEKVLINRNICTACGECSKKCPSEALDIIGEIYTCEEIINIVKRDKIFYGNKGGITVSGGETMSQFDFTFAMAAAAKEENISFVMETSGYY